MMSAVKALVPRPLELSARYWYRSVRGRLDRELLLAQQLVRPGSTAIDAGANVGIYSYALARRAHVEAFEPLPAPADTLSACRAARRGRIRVHRVALSDASGVATLRIPIVDGRAADQSASLAGAGAAAGAAAGDYATLEVELRTLDSYDLRNVSLLKIDTEGHEAAVLRGAEAVLARERPVILTEIEQRHLGDVPIESVFEAIAGRGYVGGFRDGDRMVPIARFRYATHQKPFLAPTITDPRYVNNFFFVPREDASGRNRLGL